MGGRGNIDSASRCGIWAIVLAAKRLEYRVRECASGMRLRLLPSPCLFLFRLLIHYSGSLE